MNKVFYHGINDHFIIGILRILAIVQTGGIKSKRLLNYTNSYGYNGMDYVSVCTKEKQSIYEKYATNAFTTYIRNHCCVIISGDIPAVKTEYVSSLEPVCGDSKNRVSDLCDEWQVKDQIGLEHIVAIGLPMASIQEHLQYLNDKNLKIHLEKLCEIADEMNWELVDTSNPNFSDKFELTETTVSVNTKIYKGSTVNQ